MPSRGSQTPGSGPHRLYLISGCVPRARRGWDRVTARELQVTRVCAQRPGRSLSLCPEGQGWTSSRALPPLPASPCLCAWGTKGLWGGQRGPGRDVRTPGPGVVPKIVNQGNHQGAHTDGNSRGFLYKLELGCNCTQHSGAGTWIPRLRGIAAL